MSDEERLMHHEYDGIQEYDNPLPGWWSGTFILSIVFAIGYWLWYHGPGPGKLPEEKFAGEWNEYVAWKTAAEASATIVVTEETMAQMAHDAAVVDAGRKVFTQNCVGCHMEDGRGQVGPNLTDEFQIHGVGLKDLYNTIRDGVPAKGMIAWGNTLAPRDLAAVAAFVSTLRGTNVPGKPPEGGKIALQ